MNIVQMLITCWIVQNGQIQEAWHYHDETSPEVCMAMSSIFAQGGSRAVMTVRCDTTPSIGK